SGHVVAEPATTLMKSRRRITAPKAQEHADTGSLQQDFATSEMGFTGQVARQQSRAAHVRFGSKADMCSARRHVRFAPNSDRESGHVPKDLQDFWRIQTEFMQTQWKAFSERTKDLGETITKSATGALKGFSS